MFGGIRNNLVYLSIVLILIVKLVVWEILSAAGVHSQLEFILR